MGIRYSTLIFTSLQSLNELVFSLCFLPRYTKEPTSSLHSFLSRDINALDFGAEENTTYLTSPKVAGNSAVMAPPKSSTGLNPDMSLRFDFFSFRKLLLWLCDVRARKQKKGSLSRDP